MAIFNSFLYVYQRVQLLLSDPMAGMNLQSLNRSSKDH